MSTWWDVHKAQTRKCGWVAWHSTHVPSRTATLLETPPSAKWKGCHSGEEGKWSVGVCLLSSASGYRQCTFLLHLLGKYLPFPARLILFIYCLIFVLLGKGSVAAMHTNEALYHWATGPALFLLSFLFYFICHQSIRCPCPQSLLVKVVS